MQRINSWAVAGMLGVIGATAGVAGAGTISGPILNPANGHTYYLLDAYRAPGGGNAIGAWASSQAEAVLLGGDLVTINDAAENTWVRDTFWPLLGGSGANSLWLGFNDTVVEGSFQWASGQAVTYTNWVPGEPAGSNGADEDYAGMLSNGMWHDIVDGPRFNDLCFGVVEIDAPTIPLPTAAAMAGVGLAGVGSRRSRAWSRLRGVAAASVRRSS